LCNKYIYEGYRERLCEHIRALSELKAGLKEIGYRILPSEPLKLVIDGNARGYRGDEIADILRSDSIECEFADSEYVVLMSTPENTSDELKRLFAVLARIGQKAPIVSPLSELLSVKPKAVTTIRKAILGRKEYVDVDDAIGRICATPTVSCPPAVPIAVSGEIIGHDHIALFKAYGITKIEVCK
jgi:arginine/lysine/ornithine decarboxylase